MCTILKKLGVEDSRIEEAKDMVARKIECELNERAINPPWCHYNSNRDGA